MSYIFTEKEKQFILDCITEDDLKEAKEYIMSIDGDLEIINSYYMDLLHKAQNYVISSIDENTRNIDLLTNYTVELARIYNIINTSSDKDIDRARNVADNVYEMIDEIELKLKEKKKENKKKSTKLQKILENISSQQ